MSDEKYAFIGERDTLDYELNVLHLPYNTPPKYSDSNFFLDFMSIALKKEFELKIEFKRMWVKF